MDIENTEPKNGQDSRSRWWLQRDDGISIAILFLFMSFIFDVALNYVSRINVLSQFALFEGNSSYLFFPSLIAYTTIQITTFFFFYLVTFAMGSMKSWIIPTSFIVVGSILGNIVGEVYFSVVIFPSAVGGLATNIIFGSWLWISLVAVGGSMAGDRHRMVKSTRSRIQI
ncbi:MAG: hypothetical protein M1344_01105 [Candidatus Thermoplasmatota archaeon]|nr:hypothetical protein [Candidatus Thermoplasmatota archaeon]